MPPSEPQYDLVCRSCQRREAVSLVDALARLRAAGMLKREGKPDSQMVWELLRSSAAGWTCEACGKTGLAIEESRDSDDDWGEATRPCESCGKPISAERLSFNPKAKLCVACQQKSDQGHDAAQPDYCPRCGSIMVVRQSRGAGIARYVMECTQCKR